MRGLPCFTCRKRLDLMLLLSAIGFVSLECMQDLFLNLKQMLRNIYKCTIFKNWEKEEFKQRTVLLSIPQCPFRKLLCDCAKVTKYLKKNIRSTEHQFFVLLFF